MIRVQYLDPWDGAVPVYGDELGRVFFDVDEGEEIVMGKGVERMAEFTEVSQEAAQRITLSDTERNRRLLDAVQIDGLDVEGKVVRVEVVSDGVVISLGEGIIVGYDEGGFELELYSDEWLERAKDVLVKDVDLGTFEFTEANVIAAWGSQEGMVKPVVADYGAFWEMGQVVMKDLRMWFSLWEVLKAGFAEIGWEFDSDHYRVGDGRHWYGYLSGEWWHYYREKKEERYVIVELGSEVVIPGAGTVLFDEVHDPFDLYDNPFRPREYLYGNIDPMEVRLEVNVQGIVARLPPPPPGSPRAYVFGLSLTRRGTGGFEAVRIETRAGSLTQTVEVEVSYKELIEGVVSGDSFGLLFTYNDPETGAGGVDFSLLSGRVEFRPDPDFYVEGDVIELRDLVNEELTLEELFLGAAHLINGKVLVDVDQRKVRLMPPFGYQTEEGNVVEGFYQREEGPLEIESYQVRDGVSWEGREGREPRFLRLGFEEISDEYLENADYDRRVDLGSGESREEQSRNPIFEPTGDRLTETPEVGGEVWVPVLWDNLQGERSRELGYRIGVFYGEVDMGDVWSFEDQVRGLFPHLSQRSRVTEPFPPGVEFVPIVFRGYRSDLFERYWKGDLRLMEGEEVEVRVVGDQRLYEAINFRKLMRVRFMSGYVMIQPMGIKEYRPGNSEDEFMIVGKVFRG